MLNKGKVTGGRKGRGSGGGGGGGGGGWKGRADPLAWGSRRPWGELRVKMHGCEGGAGLHSPALFAGRRARVESLAAVPPAPPPSFKKNRSVVFCFGRSHSLLVGKERRWALAPLRVPCIALLELETTKNRTSKNVCTFLFKQRNLRL